MHRTTHRIRRRIAAVLVILMATAGLGVVSPGAAQAATDCTVFATTTNGNGSALMVDTYPLKTGPYADCAKTSTDGVSAGTRLYFWCYTMNSFDNKWWYARVDGTTDYGWIYETHLTSIDLASDADATTPVKECVFTGQPAVGARTTVPATACSATSPGPAITTTRPTFASVVTDPQSNPTAAEFEWWNTTGTRIGGGATVALASGATGSVTVPAGVLANGGTYAWRVRATDLVTLFSPWSSLCRFTVNTGISAAAGVSSSSYPRDTWAGAAGTAGTFTLTPPSGQIATAYLYGLNTASPATRVTAAADGTATVSVAPATAGVQRLAVRAIDGAGNLSSSLATYQFGAGRGAEDVAARTVRTMTAAETTAMATLEPFALTFLKNRAAAITGAASSGTVPFWTGMSTRETAAATELAQSRAALATDSLSYVSSTVALSDGMVQIAGNQTYYWTLESTVLTPPAGSAEPASEYAAERVFVFVNDGSSWKLTDQALTVGAYLPPITEPASQVDTTIPVQVDQVIYSTNAVELYDNDPTADDTLSPEDLATVPAEAAATLTGSDPVETPVKVDATTTGGVATQAIPTGLCYSCMTDYARRYAKSPNRSYRYYGDPGEGGDCTNFISQALRAGGWKNDTGLYRSSKNWWYNSVNQTWTWTSAEYWSRFAPRRTKYLNNVWNLGMGDVLQVDFNADGRMDHTTMVTKISRNEIYLSYHSNGTLDKALSTFIRSTRTNHPNAIYYAYRT